MTPVFPIDGYRQPIAEITESIYANLLSLNLRRLDGFSGTLPAGLTAAVYYAGAWKGAVLVECTAEQAGNWAARLMSLTPPIEPNDAHDALGELTNVIAGNLKPLLPPGVGVSIPSVVQGTDYSLRILGGNCFESVYFEDDGGPFRVTLVEVTA